MSRTTKKSSENAAGRKPKPAASSREAAICTAVNAAMAKHSPNAAPLSKPQLASIEATVKGKNILQTVKLTEKQLRAYAENAINHTALPKPARDALRTLTDKSNANEVKRNAVPKLWGRKVAITLLVLAADRKKAARKSAKPKPAAAPTPVETTTAA